MRPGLLAAVLLVSTSAYADIIEIRGKGFLNGHIVSQDDRQVTFKDSKNNVHVVPRADVSFLEHEEDKPKPLTWTQNLAAMFRKFKAGLAPKVAPPLQSRPRIASDAGRRTGGGAEAGSAEPASGISATTAMGQSEAAMQMVGLAGQAQAHLQVQQARLQKALGDPYGINTATGSAGEQVYDARKGRFGTLSDQKEE